MSTEIQAARIFIAYSSTDLEFQKELKNHLEPLVRNKRIVVMDNYAINPGDNWEKKIGQMLEQSDIVLLLLSADALASPHFFREAGIAIERRRQGRSDIIPVKLRPCDLDDEPLLQELDLLEVLPEKDVPVVKWQHRDDAYLSIVKGLKKVLRVREEASAAREERAQQAIAAADDDAAWQRTEKNDTEAAYKKYLQQYPDGLYAAQAAQKIATYEQAREAAEAAEKEKQESARRASEESARLKKEQEDQNRLEAMRFFDLGSNTVDLREKIKHYSKAIELDPEYASAYNSRGAAQYGLERHIEAIEDYDKAIRFKPDYAYAYYNRGLTNRSLGQNAEAIEDFDQYIHLAPDDADAYIGRGNAKYSLGQYAEAIKDFDQALRLNPDLANAYNGRGATKQMLGLREEAKKDYQKALSINPDYELAKNNLKSLA
jgi:tetratricopeptide (TPR) repeat protein